MRHDWESLKCGDHVTRPLRRIGGVAVAGASHHGIVSATGPGPHDVRVIEFGGKDDAGAVGEVSWAQFMNGESAFAVVEYTRADGPERVLERARGELGKGDYHLAHSNCEHFATWCKTGVHFSAQVAAVEEQAASAGAELREFAEQAAAAVVVGAAVAGTTAVVAVGAVVVTGVAVAAAGVAAGVGFVAGAAADTIDALIGWSRGRADGYARG